MPLYEYQCDACGHRFENIQKFSDPLIESCPACGGAVKKLVSSPAIQFKGAGWYINDYAKKSSPDASGSKSSSSDSAKSGESSSSEKKADTTPAPSTSTPSKD